MFSPTMINEIRLGANHRKESRAAFGLNVAERRKYLSKELIGLWARADKKANPTGKDAGPIDWDVTTNSQGLEVGSYALEVVRQDDNRVELKATIEAKTEWTRNSPDDQVGLFFGLALAPLGLLLGGDLAGLAGALPGLPVGSLQFVDLGQLGCLPGIEVRQGRLLPAPLQQCPQPIFPWDSISLLWPLSLFLEATFLTNDLSRR